MTISCRNCGQSWPRDPVLKVTCPSCGRGIGRKCQRPSGHPCSVHTARDKLALEEVDDYDECPESTAEVNTSIEEETQQVTLSI